ncbi:hypothetical protein J7T55_015219 [Diaporthe amygdali]|uniref:uncharacterized protein n=1 Tax=Phomopsis amygdali TaxID=1214568 RepID=UPI0022FDCE4C|nr:uncharacterized protein J7T55_015219 [Diaporthe amygdali]KAJ0120490.1 hypothetical protein J7T55_015219 [Diaporthe amygdali]
MPKYYETAAHVIAASVALPVVDILAVALKFKVRRIQKQPLKADDWSLVPATLLTLAIGIVLSYGATHHHAIGWPLEIPPDSKGGPARSATEQEMLARKVQYVFLLLYPLAIGSTKASLLFLYRRIFTINRRTRVIIVFTIALVGAWMAAFFFAELFQCSTKFWANWGSSHDIQTQCNKTTMIIFSVCLTDFLFDLTILIMPIPLKIGVLSIFLLGIVFVHSSSLACGNPLIGHSTVTASLVRLALLIPRVFSLEDTDASHRFVSLTTSLYWGMVEAGVGIFVACLPTLQFLFRKNKWRALFGLTATTPPSSAGLSISRSSKFKLSSNPAIQVDRTVDVTYANVDSNPILMKNQNWVHNNRSEGGLDDIEMQDDIFEVHRR